MKIAENGIWFGGAFVPLYLNHPLVYGARLCDTDRRSANLMRERRYGEVRDLRGDFCAVFSDSSVDCVSILTPPAPHAEMSALALGAGKILLARRSSPENSAIIG